MDEDWPSKIANQQSSIAIHFFTTLLRIPGDDSHVAAFHGRGRLVGQDRTVVGDHDLDIDSLGRCRIPTVKAIPVDQSNGGTRSVRRDTRSASENT